MERQLRRFLLVVSDARLGDRVEAELLRSIRDGAIERVGDREPELRARLAAGTFELVIVSVDARWQHGMVLVRAAKQVCPALPVLMLIDAAHTDGAVAALGDGVAQVALRDERSLGLLAATVWSTVRMVAQQGALAAAELRYRDLFENVPIGIYATSPEGEVLAANPMLVSMLGYPSLAAFRAVNTRQLYVEPTDRDRWRGIMERDGVVTQFETRKLRFDGRPLWLRDSARAIRDAAGRLLHYEGAVIDVTPQREAEDRLAELAATLEERNRGLEQLSVTDALTGLHNRRGFAGRISYEVSRTARSGGAVSLLMLDVDRFKRINDTWQHEFGDEVLRHVGPRMAGLLRKTDLVARLGGDEFAVVLPDTEASGAEQAAQKLLQGFAQSPLLASPSGEPLTVTMSFGVAWVPGPFKGRYDADEVGRRLTIAADRELYVSKRAGRNCVTVAGVPVPWVPADDPSADST